MKAHPRTTLIALVLALVVLAVGCGSSKKSPSSSPPTSGSQLSLDTGPAPWPDPNQVPQRTAAAGLVGGPTEILIVHYHAHLDIFVNGTPEPVAASIGRVDQSYFSPLHTHATSGMIHIEAAEDRKITLGNVFTEWGVRLTAKCAGEYCAPATPVSAYVDGTRATAPLPDIVLKKGEEIALVIGTPPAKIPSSWDCLAGIDPRIEASWQCGDFGETVPSD